MAMVKEEEKERNLALLLTFIDFVATTVAVWSPCRYSTLRGTSKKNEGEMWRRAGEMIRKRKEGEGDAPGNQMYSVQ